MTVAMFINIVTDDNSKAIDGYVLIYPTNPGRLLIPARSKYNVGTERITEDLYVSHVISINIGNESSSSSSTSVAKKITATVSDPWRDNIAKKIHWLLIESIKDKKIVSEKVISEIANNESWKAIFTHVSFNPDPSNNYETMETLGDKVMSLVFVNRLVNEEKNTRKPIDPNTITDIHKEILSRPKQKIMGQFVEFDKLIRSSVTVDDAIIEDVIEAFFGNLFSLTNMLTQNNYGFIVCSLVFTYIFKNTFPDLDIYEIKKDPQTILDQMFQKLGWGHPEFEYDKINARSTIIIPDDVMSKLPRPPFLYSTKVLATAEGINKKDAEKKASIMAIDFLKANWGIDHKFIKEAVRERLMMDSRYESAYNKAMIKARKASLVDLYVQKKAKHRIQYYIVTGIKEDGNELALFSYKFEDGKTESNVEGQINALTSYAKQ